MSTGKSTGASPNGADGAKHRAHHDGSSSRAYTEDQKAAVIRVRKCGNTAYYDILGLEQTKTTVDENGIKKAYRKLSLLTHPDKNGYEGADEAFKCKGTLSSLLNAVVSRAFQVLSDADKRKKYDQFGGDPDSRFSSAAAASPFSARAPTGAAFDGEITPEELFRQFFGGGGFGGGFGSPFGKTSSGLADLGGGVFDNGPGFVFNLGGGPGFRVHQFGGRNPRRRQPAQHAGGNAPQPTAMDALRQLLPLLLLVLVPLLSSLLSGDAFSSTPKLPRFSIDRPIPPQTQLHETKRFKTSYYVNPVEVAKYSVSDWARVDQAVDNSLVNKLNLQCETEQRHQQRLAQEAQGWFSIDAEKMDEAANLPMPACQRLQSLPLRRNNAFW